MSPSHCGLIGLGGRKFGRIDGDLHRLLLEYRHAEGASENVLQLQRIVRRAGARVFHRLLPRPASQIGMHHVALDGAGADDGDLDHQIVEPAGAQARQHVHLRPAFDLEDADAVALAEYVVDPRILLRDARQGMGLSVVGFDQIEALVDAGEHAERQDVDLEDTERVDIVLVPFDEAALRHGSVADGHGFGQRGVWSG